MSGKWGGGGGSTSRYNQLYYWFLHDNSYNLLYLIIFAVSSETIVNNLDPLLDGYICARQNKCFHSKHFLLIVV